MSNIQPDDVLAVPAVRPERNAVRHRVLKSAKIVLDDWCAIDCMLRDISETGAKIRVADVTSLPHKFRLLTLSDNLIREVQVAWKHHDEVGVAFRGPPKSCALRKL